MVTKIKRCHYQFLWCAIILGLFLLLPFALIRLGYQIETALIFVIGVSAILADGFLTNIGLKSGCSELNLSFQLLHRKTGKKSLLVLSRLLGIAVLTVLLVTFKSAFLLLTIALLGMVCVVANTITLLYSVDKKVGDADKE